MPSQSLDRRTAVPSRRLLAAGVLLSLVAATVPVVPALGGVVWALGALLALALGVDLLARPARDGVTVTRALQHSYNVGRRSTYRLHLHNTTDRALRVNVHEVLALELEGEGYSEVLLLGAGERIEREVEFVGLRRGEHRLLPVGVRVSHPLGLLSYQHTRDLDQSAVVIPGRPAGETEWLLSQAAAIEELGRKRIRRKGAEQDFESLREYVVGDPLRRLDWKASARRHKPMVRQYQSERNAEVIIAVDCGRLMGSLIDGIPKLDLALTPILDLAAVALNRGERVGFLAFDSQARAFIPPRNGLGHLNQILRTAAALPTAHDPTSYLRAVSYLEARHRKRCLLLVFTDFTDELSAQDMYSSLVALTRRHVLIFIAVGDPQLQVIFDSESTETRALYQKAVAGQLLGERKRVLARLERLGIYTVDAEPMRLTAPLIRRYLEVRLRGVV